MNQAKNAVKMIHLLIKDLKSLCVYYIKKQEAKEEFLEENNEEQEKGSTGGGIGGGSYFHNYSLYSPNSMAAAAYNNLESPLSMIEKTAKRILPIVDDVQKLLIKEKTQVSADSIEEDLNAEGQSEEDEVTAKIRAKFDTDMRSVLGYLNQSEWIQNINIGNIM